MSFKGDDVLHALQKRARERAQAEAASPATQHPRITPTRTAPTDTIRTRVDMDVLNRRVAMLISDEQRRRSFLQLDEHRQREAVGREMQFRLPSVHNIGSRNALYVECVRETVAILNDESEARDALDRWHDTFLAEQQLIDGARETAEQKAADDIVRQAMRSAKHQWALSRIDDALILLHNSRKKIQDRPVLDAAALLEDSSMVEHLSDAECINIALRSLKDADRKPVDTMQSMHISPQRTGKGGLPQAPCSHLTEDDALEAINAFRIKTALLR